MNEYCVCILLIYLNITIAMNNFLNVTAAKYCYRVDARADIIKVYIFIYFIYLCNNFVSQVNKYLIEKKNQQVD